MNAFPSMFPEAPEMVELRIGPAFYRVARDGSFAERAGKPDRKTGVVEWSPVSPFKARELAGMLKQ